MAITYVWGVDRLDTKTVEDELSNVVKVVHWVVTGTDEDTGTIASVRGASGLGTASADTFTSFESLTLDQVKGWILAALAREEETPEDVEQDLQSRIDTKIARKLNPPMVAKDAPWV
jgi:hypothetical protein